MATRPKLKKNGTGERRQPTRERLLDTAGILLAEVGVERISTNMICERAGVTPPALYYYFADKYEVIAALGQRLMDLQNAVLARWIERYAGGGIHALAMNTEVLLRETAEITEAEPGGVWIERALHSSPRLEHVRIESHRFVTDLLTDACVQFLPDRPRAIIWLRMRMLVEFGYGAMELLHAETQIDHGAILAETAAMQKLAMFDLIGSSLA